MANILMRAPPGASQVLVRDGTVLQIQASGLVVVDAGLGYVADLLALGFTTLDTQSPQYLTQVAANPAFAALPF